MKKLAVVSVAIALSISASAAWKEIGYGRLAGPEVLSANVMQVMNFTGNPMLGMMAAGIVASPYEEEFGPMRKGAAICYLLLADDSSPSKPVCEYAILYPTVWKRGDFLKHGYQEGKDGMLVRKQPVCCFDDDDDDSSDLGEEDVVTVGYAKLTPDGKWVACSDKSEQVEVALKATAITKKPLDGAAADFKVNRVCVESLKGAIGDAEVSNVLDGCQGIAGSMRVTDRGLDLSFAVKTVAGSELGKIGHKTLAADALKFADADGAFSASAAAADAGQQMSGYEFWQRLCKVFKNRKIDFAKVLDCRKDGTVSRFTLDLPELVKLVLSNSERVGDFSAIERFGKELCAELEALDDGKFKAAGPAQSVSLVSRQAKMPVAISKLFAATLPEAAEKHPYAVSVGSVAWAVRELVPAAIDALPAEIASDAIKAASRQCLKQLPEKSATGSGSMLWRDGDDLCSLVRLGPDEFRVISSLFSIQMAIQMQQAMQAGGRLSAEDGEDDAE